jgi:hypothetical protein
MNVKYGTEILQNLYTKSSMETYGNQTYRRVFSYYGNNIYEIENQQTQWYPS